MDWIALGQDRDNWRMLVNAVMKLRVPQNAGNYLNRWEPVSLSGRTLLIGVSYCRSIQVVIEIRQIEGYFTHTELCCYHAQTTRCVVVLGIWILSFPLEMYSKTVSESHIPDCGPTVPRQCLHGLL